MLLDYHLVNEGVVTVDQITDVDLNLILNEVGDEHVITIDGVDYTVAVGEDNSVLTATPGNVVNTRDEVIELLEDK